MTLIDFALRLIGLAGFGRNCLAGSGRDLMADYRPRFDTEPRTRKSGQPWPCKQRL